MTQLDDHVVEMHILTAGGQINLIQCITLNLEYNIHDQS